MPTKKAVQEIAENFDVVEEVVDKAIEGVDAVDHASHVAAVATKRGLRTLKNPRIVAYSAIGLSIAAGAALGVSGYFLLKKRLEKKYEERLNQELEEMRTFYKRRYKADSFATPESAAKAMHTYKAPDETVDIPVVEKRGLNVIRGKGGEPGYVEKTEIVQEENIFLNGQPVDVMEWNLEVEESKRSPESPYVISFEEFTDNAFEHEQQNLTYYEGDDVLTQMDDVIIDDLEGWIGSGNLSRFGHGSKDRNVVYIRNERLERDFEVVRSTGKYAEEVHGLQHSDYPTKRRTKARWGDDE